MARLHSNPLPVLRIYLVDDAPVVRKGLHSLLDLEPGLRICGEAGGEHEALAGILATRPDLAFVDLCLNQGGGLTLIRRLHQLRPGLRILVFSGRDEVQVATAAFKAGAHGYLLKEEATEQVVQAIQAVRESGYYLSAAIASKAPGLGRPLAKAVPRARRADGSRLRGEKRPG